LAVSNCGAYAASVEEAVMLQLEALLRERLSSDLHAAMKTRDAVRVASVRSLLGALDNAGAVEPARAGSDVPRSAARNRAAEQPRRELSEGDLAKVLARELGERCTAVMHLEKHACHEEAERVRAEIKVLSDYVSYFETVRVAQK
jgi:uncharacterized protein